MNANIKPLKNYTQRLQQAADSLPREWLAYLKLEFASRVKPGTGNVCTILERSDHRGPLRVQRPFYPHNDTSCHIYLLHPPGGLVIGDQLDLTINAKKASHVLLTTPSAGKCYGLKQLGSRVEANQQQNIHIKVDDACVEWLPQETIIFNSARARLNTKVELFGDNAQCFLWDIVRLGRIASGEFFEQGSCHQTLEVWKNNKPYFIEKNKVVARSELSQALWGFQNQHTFGTLLATLKVAREKIDEMVAELEENFSENDHLNSGLDGCLDSSLDNSLDSSLVKNSEHWALTQKKELFIVRYLGHSVTSCRAGFEYIWRNLREDFNGHLPVNPRIWNT